MDISNIAQAIIPFLAPALPYLLEIGGHVKDKAAEEIGDGIWETAQSIWEKLTPKLDVWPEAKTAAIELAHEPNEPDAQAALRHQIKKWLLADNGHLAGELEIILNSAGPKLDQSNNNSGIQVNQGNNNQSTNTVFNSPVHAGEFIINKHV